MKPEQGVAPGWFQALLCVQRTSTEHTGKNKTHHSVIPFQILYSLGCKSQSFWNVQLVHLHQQWVWGQCHSTSVPVPILEAGHTLPLSLLSWDSFRTCSDPWDVTPRSQEPVPSVRLLPRDQALLAGAVMPIHPAGIDFYCAAYSKPQADLHAWLATSGEAAGVTRQPPVPITSAARCLCTRPNQRWPLSSAFCFYRP